MIDSSFEGRKGDEVDLRCGRVGIWIIGII